MKAWQIATILILTAIPLYIYSENYSVTSEKAFRDWTSEFGYSFSNEEAAFRNFIFMHNLEEIEKHNADKTQTYTKGVNQFTHLNQAEFKAMFLNKFYENYETKSQIV
jgi:hypothetical protein